MAHKLFVLLLLFFFLTLFLRYRDLVQKESTFQKQPSRCVPTKSCSENIQQIYRRITMPKCVHESRFKIIEITLYWNPINFLYIFRTPFPKNTSGWLLLKLLLRFTVPEIYILNYNFKKATNFVVRWSTATDALYKTSLLQHKNGKTFLDWCI